MVGESYADFRVWLETMALGERAMQIPDCGLIGSIAVLHWVYLIKNTSTKVILLSIAI